MLLYCMKVGNVKNFFRYTYVNVSVITSTCQSFIKLTMHFSLVGNCFWQFIMVLSTVKCKVNYLTAGTPLGN